MDGILILLNAFVIEIGPSIFLRKVIKFRLTYMNSDSIVFGSSGAGNVNINRNNLIVAKILF